MLPAVVAGGTDGKDSAVAEMENEDDHPAFFATIPDGDSSESPSGMVAKNAKERSA